MEIANSSLPGQALDALRSVIDPELELNVVDLGLIYRIDFDAESRLVVEMTLTTRFCPMGESIGHAVLQCLSEAFPEREVAVNVTFTLPWNQDRISEAGRQFLNR